MKKAFIIIIMVVFILRGCIPEKYESQIFQLETDSLQEVGVVDTSTYYSSDDFQVALDAIPFHLNITEDQIPFETDGFTEINIIDFDKRKKVGVEFTAIGKDQGTRTRLIIQAYNFDYPGYNSTMKKWLGDGTEVYLGENVENDFVTLSWFVDDEDDEQTSKAKTINLIYVDEETENKLERVLEIANEMNEAVWDEQYFPNREARNEGKRSARE
ncbi:hypothetical protein [Evansella cellulosilytica]|uniref:Uncharacterized protein n=1 Tax=Evansella cellulosilytica (strain ATCC 21833 / DSM 2522 / FERM P-1141 / JCM 9156 / N-4) TaxID=649639 RepID=E6U1B8_EVAC2|nr:hypothetical protein [Evansella cellulosilytica]ADU29165.1 hypothetical protein Bcell_0889 [Evansella cellulosilytica DSM 2522]